MTEALSVASGATPALTEPSASEPPPALIPVITEKKTANDSEHTDSIELRAYKLGKKRWLYNECRLNLRAKSGYHPPLQVTESARQGEDSIPQGLQDCGVTYGLKLKGNLRLELEVYVVFDEPQQVDMPLDAQACLVNMQHGLSLSSVAGYKWPPVHRQDCQKGCDGPILRSIQRYGRISRRTNKKNSPEMEQPEDRAKDPRFLYLSIDEASTHVGGKRFRLIAAAYDMSRKLLGSCCSLPINVLANNDAPNGPATIDLDLCITDSWEGWATIDGSLSDEQQLRNNSVDSLQREHYSGLDSHEPSSSLHTGSFWNPNLSQSQNERSAKDDLQLIRYRAMMSEGDEAEASFEDSIPNAKRGRSSYGLEGDLGLPPFFPGLETAGTQQLTSSGFSSSLGYIPDTLRLDSMADHSSLESSHGQLRMHDSLEPGSLRHNSITDSSGMRHNSGELPQERLPDLSVMRNYSLAAMSESAMRHSSISSQMRYNSLQVGPPPLLSELQASRAPYSELRDNSFWTNLQSQQGLAPQSSAVRQESSPAMLQSLTPSSHSFWSDEPPRVHQAQNPSISPANRSNQFTNPFAHHNTGTVRDQEFWRQQLPATGGGQYKNHGQKQQGSQP